MVRLFSMVSLPEQIENFIKSGDIKYISNNNQTIDFSNDLFYDLFKNVKKLRASLPTSYLNLNDFKIFFFKIDLPIHIIINIIIFVFRIFHEKTYNHKNSNLKKINNYKDRKFSSGPVKELTAY
jgi:fumarate reductase subunit C